MSGHVHQPDGRRYRALVSQTEQPGRYFHPLIATLTSSGGRLLLATALALAEQLGGFHTMCHTDGLLIPATRTGGLLHCLGGSHTLDYGAYFTEYRAHPEHKALGPNGEPCHAWTRGLLKPPILEAAPTLLRIGRESLPGAVDEPDLGESCSPEIIYVERVCPGCGGSLRDRQTRCSDRCRKRLVRAALGASP